MFFVENRANLNELMAKTNRVANNSSSFVIRWALAKAAA